MLLIGKKISQYRQNRGLTQEEFALKLGVTSQAVSKWERESSLPDIGLVTEICSILQIDANTLLGIDQEEKINGNNCKQLDYLDCLCADAITLLIGEALISTVSEGLEAETIKIRRRKLANEKHLLMPTIRIRDNMSLKPLEYQILVYGKCVQRAEGAVEFLDLVTEIENIVEKEYGNLLNHDITKQLMDAVTKISPGTVAGVIPEKISYSYLQRVLKELWNNQHSIFNLIQIIESIEWCLEEDPSIRAVDAAAKIIETL